MSEDPAKAASITTVVGPAQHRPGSDDVVPAIPSARGEVLEDRGALGEGGTSVVKRVYDPSLRRELAMKVLSDRFVGNREALLGFVQEAEITAQLEHPNIVPVHSLRVADDGTTYFTMRLVRGRTYDALVADHAGHLDEPEVLHRLVGVFLKVCDALAYAHSRGVLHLDLKPENVMVGSFGEVYLMDFGIAALHPTGTADPARAISLSGDRNARAGVRGSPAYMAPEQARGRIEDLDERTDVFGLGALLYFLLTGKAPFDGASVNDALARAREGAYADPERIVGGGALAGLARIARWAMSERREDRPASVAELQREVELHLRGGAHFPTRAFAAGAVIVREGANADAAYVLVSGSCVVWKNVAGQRVELRRLEPGAVFGETAIFSGSVRTATVEAVNSVTVKVVTREIIERQLGGDSWLGRFVLALAERFREVDDKLIALTRT